LKNLNLPFNYGALAFYPETAYLNFKVGFHKQAADESRLQGVLE